MPQVDFVAAAFWAMLFVLVFRHRLYYLVAVVLVGLVGGGNYLVYVPAFWLVPELLMNIGDWLKKK